MGITGLLDTPFYTGGSISALVPDIYPLAINGRPYDVDTLPENSYARWNVETIPLIRQQADQSNAPAEATLNPQGLWRRAQDSFHHGAGQVYRDRDDKADAYRYRSSKGLDPWTRYQLSLLNDTERKKTSANTNLIVVSAGARLYVADGTTVTFSTDITGAAPTFTAVTYAGGSVLAMCSDGFNVYVSDGANVYLTDTTSTTLTSTNTLDAGGLAYTKGRLMASGTGATKNSIYNITVIGTPPVALFTHGNANFTWVGFTEGTAAIYAAGYSGDKSLIYRIAVKPDATTLDAPIIAGELPDGEIITGIGGYLGFVFLGTSRGVRFCEVSAQGDLTIGPVILTSNSVRAFEPQDRFMWFGWTAYDVTSTGLGRIDLTEFVGTDQPAHASDLMATGSGAILSIASFQNLRVFAVSGAGIYAQTSTLVTSGTVDTGGIGFGIPDPKTGLYVDVRTTPLVGSYVASISIDDGPYTSVGSESNVNDTGDSFPIGGHQGERFEVRLTLTRATTTTGPTILRWTLKVLPTTADGPAEIFHIPLKLYPVLFIKGREYECDVQTELNEFSALRASRQVVQLQQFDASYSVIVSDWKWFPFGLTDDGDGSWGAKGTLLADLQRVS